MNDQVTYVSSVKNTYKKAKLNNVIQSLNCFVSCTTPDVTEQDYGVICYCGKVAKGQYIKGNRPPRKAGTPVIVSNIWLGTIDNNGNLYVENASSSEASFVTTEQWRDIQMTFNPSATGSSYYYCDSPRRYGPHITCACCHDDRGDYMLEVSTTCTCTTYHEKCFYAQAFPGLAVMEEGDNYCRWRAFGGTHSEWYGNSHEGAITAATTQYIWCNGALYYNIYYRAYNHVWYDDDYEECYEYCVGQTYGPYLHGWCNGHLCISGVASQGLSTTVKVEYYENGHSVQTDYYTCYLNKQSSYCASDTGHISVSDNPVFCNQFEVCRCIRQLEDEVCFCVRYY